MSVDNGKVCCNCRHCIRSHDDKYDIIVFRCDVHDRYLSYAEVMRGWCRRWAKERRADERL